VSNNSSIATCAFVCQGNAFTELLRGNNRRDTHTDTQIHRESRLTTAELLRAVFSLRSDLKLYKNDNYGFHELEGDTDTQTAS
jgi:hypothetical protein